MAKENININPDNMDNFQREKKAHVLFLDGYYVVG